MMDWSILSVTQFRYAKVHLLIKERMLTYRNSGEPEKCQKIVLWTSGRKQYFYSKSVTLRLIRIFISNFQLFLIKFFISNSFSQIKKSFTNKNSSNKKHFLGLKIFFNAQLYLNYSSFFYLNQIFSLKFFIYPLLFELISNLCTRLF
jgi:hypothetical protein